MVPPLRPEGSAFYPRSLHKSTSLNRPKASITLPLSRARDIKPKKDYTSLIFVKTPYLRTVLTLSESINIPIIISRLYQELLLVMFKVPALVATAKAVVYRSKHGRGRPKTGQDRLYS